NIDIARNSILLENADAAGYWKAFYDQIDAANSVLKLIPNVADEGFGGSRKQEILADAHFLRAMSHFQLLRFYGQFYDRSSTLGIIIRTEPADFTTRDKKRSTVEETYNLILADLDRAIADG